MSQRSIPWLPMGVLALLLALTYWLSSIVQPERARKSSSPQRHEPDLIIEGFTAQKMSPTGDVQYAVKAAKMLHYQDDESSELTDVVFTATRADQPRLTISAPNGKLNQGGDEVVMAGGVVLERSALGKSAALIVRTPKLTVLPDQNIARSVDGVTMESPLGKMRAQRFELNSEKQTAIFERGTMVLKPIRESPEGTR